MTRRWSGLGKLHAFVLSAFDNEEETPMPDIIKPSNTDQVKEQLDNIAKNASHVLPIAFDEGSHSILIRLDGKAHFFGHHDVQIVVQQDKMPVAKDLVTRIERTLRSGHPATYQDARELFDVLEH